MDTNPYIDELGAQHWYEHGERHRLDGPAVIDNDGSEAWFERGQLHRLDGPAFTNQRGIYWYIRGNYIKTAERYQFLSGKSDEEMMLLILKYGEIK